MIECPECARLRGEGAAAFGKYTVRKDELAMIRKRTAEVTRLCRPHQSRELLLERPERVFYDVGMQDLAWRPPSSCSSRAIRETNKLFVQTRSPR